IHVFKNADSVGHRFTRVFLAKNFVKSLKFVIGQFDNVFFRSRCQVDKPPQLIDRYTTEIVPELHTTFKISV
ncbi:hypothetical protein ACXO2X_09540, partial [Lactobacillus delbrueckii subsp. bulgaricus]